MLSFVCDKTLHQTGAYEWPKLQQAMYCKVVGLYAVATKQNARLIWLQSVPMHVDWLDWLVNWH